MKTPFQWSAHWHQLGLNARPDGFQGFIEAIQRDALSDHSDQTGDLQEASIQKEFRKKVQQENRRLVDEVERYRLKWLEARKHLRAANKGAERSAIAMQLAHARVRNYWLSDKRSEEKEKHSMETKVWEWLSLSDEDLRLRMGELTSQEIRNCRALLRALIGTKKLTTKP